MTKLVPFHATTPARPVRSRPVRRPRRRAVLASDGSVLLEWDEGRGLYIAVCDRCTETFTVELLDQAHEWADDHRCDPELAALLDQITRRAA
jgi:hypothetical protein